MAANLRFVTPLPVGAGLRFGALPNAQVRYLGLTMAGHIGDTESGSVSIRPIQPLAIRGQDDAAGSGAISITCDLAVNRAPGASVGAVWRYATSIAGTGADRWQSPDLVPIQIAATAGGIYQVAGHTGQPAMAMSRVDESVRIDGLQALALPSDVALVWSGLVDTALIRRVAESKGLALTPVTVGCWLSLADRSLTWDGIWGGGNDMVGGAVARYGQPIARDKWLGGRWPRRLYPGPGVSTRPGTPPTPEPPYVPADGLPLRFRLGMPNQARLRFGRIANPAQQLPIRRTYIMLNEVSLVRVDNGAEFSPLSFGVSIDYHSWVWGWNAVFQMEDLARLTASDAYAPVELEAVVNGVTWRLLVEDVPDERTFGRGRVSVSGRGIAAMLADPYASVINVGNASPMTAQQCALAALADNGVSNGWAVNWGVTDWPIPAGVWSHTGTYIEGVNRIAASVGAYVQAHRTQRVLSVLPAYPVAPWSWAGVTPDFILPAGLTTKVSNRPAIRPSYDRVYVSGESVGVLGQVTRVGSAGDNPAPMVVDALITHADAARQRGIAILGAGGPSGRLTVDTPIFSDAGLYPVGSFVQVDGQVGLVRSVQVSATFPRVRQTLELETHA